MKTTFRKLLFAICMLMCISNYINAQTPGFVYTEGEKFMLDGRPFYFSGANVYDFFTYGSSSGDIETSFMDKERIDEHMRRLYKNGIRVVRLWGFSHEDWHGFEPQKGVYSEGQFSLFDYVVKSAEANGIKLIVALENYWNDYGGIKDRLKWEGIDVAGAGTHDQGQFFTNASAIQGYKDYVEYFITRKNHYDGVEYRNDPTILAWELMNEPRYQGFGDDLASETLRAWVDDMGAFIKALDPKHLLGTGLEAHGAKYGFGGDEGNDFIKIHQSPFIDFTSAHPYIRESWSNFTLEQTMKLMEQWADESHNIIKKPLYIGEFNVEIQERFEWWEEMYRFIEESKIGASGFWWFPDNRTPRDKFGVFEGDVEVAIYKEHALKMEEMSGGEMIYLSLMSPKSGDKYVSGSEVHIEANLLNENNTVAKVEFFNNGVLVGEDVFAPYELDLQNLPDGQYKITAVATGVNGVQKESTARNIQVGGDGILTLEYRDASTAAISNVIKPQFRIFNNSSVDVPYSDLSIRYWFETENDLALNFFVDYAELGTSFVKGNIVKTEGNMHYVEISFDPAAGVIASGGGSGRMEPKVANSQWGDTDQSNDYSYDATKKEFAQWEKVTLYLNGKLISGIEPGTTIDAPNAVITSSVTSGVAPLLVTLDASGSTDPNGDLLSYTWDLGNGVTKTGVSIDHEFTEIGDQLVTLTVSDPSSNTDTDTITISVLDPNQPPVAAFTSSTNTGIAPEIISFDASSSSDPNNDTLTYSWNFGNGSTATGVTTTYEFVETGNFEVTLTVSDGKTQDTATKIISITNGDPVASITSDVTTGIAPVTISFDGSGSTDPRGNVLSYTWDFGDTMVGNGQNVTHIFDTAGVYTVTLTIDNGQGGTDTDSVVVTVTDQPVVSDLFVEYKEGGRGNTSDNMINPHLRIVNNGNQSVSYSDITIRYWFTSEENDVLNFWCDWAQLGSGFVNGSFAQGNGMNYLEISFDAGAGMINASQNSGPIQARFAKANWSNFEESDDYSFNLSSINYEANDKITMYLNGSLIWGAEPAGSLRTQQEEAFSKLIISPNPVVNELNLNTASSFKNTQIRVIDFSGRILYQKQIVEDRASTKIDFSRLQVGSYFVEIRQGDKVVTKQIIK